jgi:hypothetical protein
MIPPDSVWSSGQHQFCTDSISFPGRKGGRRMGSALGWLLIALAGTAAAPPADQNHGEITYTVQYIETQGLSWRQAMVTQLKPVARQGAATIWTAPQAAAKRLVNQVTEGHAGKILQTPKVTALNGGSVHISSRSDRSLVTQVAWGGEDHDAEPTVEKVRAGWMTTMVGRTLDQGILVQLVFEDTQIPAVHNVKVPESYDAASKKGASAWVPKPACAVNAAKMRSKQTAGKGQNPFPDRSYADIMASVEKAPAGRLMIGSCASGSTDATCCEDKCVKAQGCCETAEDEPLEDDVDVQQLTIAVPEIRSQEVAGEWLIPKDEVLLVSFGVFTAADQNGKAVVKERLAMISAAEVASGKGNDRPERLNVVPIPPPPPAMPAPYVSTIPAPAHLIAPPPVVVPAAPFNPFAVESGHHATERPAVLVPTLPAVPAMPLPAVPSRTMPEGVHKDGTISKLPPLPEEVEQPESESSEPMASPQTKKNQQLKPATDPKASKAMYAPRAAAPFSLPSLFMPSIPSTPAGLQFLLPIKPFSIKLPFKQRLEIEILGRMVPDTEPAEKTED